MSYVIGIDLGTTSLKGTVFDKYGNLIASSSKSYSLITSQTGYSEQAPDDWVSACYTVLSNLFKRVKDLNIHLEGISFSGQMHSLVLLDKDGVPLRNAILWNDVRTTTECNKIMKEYGETLKSVTKNKALEGFTLPKILWVKDNEPLLWKQVRYILLPKDYLRYNLTGHIHMDYSDASGTLLMDIRKKQWSLEILDCFGIPIDILPKLVESTDFVGCLKYEIKDHFNIQNDVKVFAGGADNACSAIGSGIVADDLALSSIGTSGVLLAIEKDIDKSKNVDLHTFNHAVTDSYYKMGVTLAAGKSLDWYKSTFAPNLTYEELLTEVNSIPSGSEGLLFTPYIMGERTPHSDSKIRGTFIGIDTQHNRGHFTRAVLEGITYSLRDCLEIILSNRKTNFDSIVSVGGGAKNKTWLQIQADIFNLPIKSLVREEGPATGAAMIAAVGLKWYKNFSDCSEKFVQYGSLTYPNSNNVTLYNQYFNIYQDIYKNTKGLSENIYSIKK